MSILLRELYLSYRFIRGDLTTTVIPSTLTLVAALIRVGSLSLMWKMIPSLMMFTLYILSFCLLNQSLGVNEDRLNKPWRPIVSGMVTRNGALTRYGFMVGFYLTLGYLLGGMSTLGWNLSWVVLVWCYELYLHTHWFNKNVVFISLGTVFQLASAWSVIGSIPPIIWNWILFTSISMGITLQIQDFRDVEGDKLEGRWTFPMAYRHSREMMSGLLVTILPAITFWILGVGIWSIGLTINNLVVATRLVKYTTPHADHWTYLIHTIWFCQMVVTLFLI